jgi:hypothetical protein
LLCLSDEDGAARCGLVLVAAKATTSVQHYSFRGRGAATNESVVELFLATAPLS